MPCRAVKSWDLCVSNYHTATLCSLLSCMFMYHCYFCYITVFKIYWNLHFYYCGTNGTVLANDRTVNINTLWQTTSTRVLVDCISLQLAVLQNILPTINCKSEHSLDKLETLQPQYDNIKLIYQPVWFWLFDQFRKLCQPAGMMANNSKISHTLIPGRKNTYMLYRNCSA